MHISKKKYFINFLNFRKSHKALRSMALQRDLYNRISEMGGGWSPPGTYKVK